MSENFKITILGEEKQYDVEFPSSMVGRELFRELSNIFDVSPIKIISVKDGRVLDLTKSSHWNIEQIIQIYGNELKIGKKTLFERITQFHNRHG